MFLNSRYEKKIKSNEDNNWINQIDHLQNTSNQDDNDNHHQSKVIENVNIQAPNASKASLTLFKNSLVSYKTQLNKIKEANKQVNPPK